MKQSPDQPEGAPQGAHVGVRSEVPGAGNVTAPGDQHLGKWFGGILYLLTAGLFGIGYLYDMWTLNEQITEVNRRA